MEFLCFQISGKYFAIDIMGIREILRSFTITDLAQSPPEIAGVFNLRGELIPIFDLRLILLNERCPENQADSNLIVIQGKNTNAGFLVDKVVEVVSVPMDSLSPIPGSDFDNEAIGVAVFQANLEGIGLKVITLLRIGTLLALEKFAIAGNHV